MAQVLIKKTQTITDIVSSPQEIIQHMVKNTTLVETLNLLYDFDLVSLTKDIEKSLIEETVKKKLFWIRLLFKF